MILRRLQTLFVKIAHGGLHDVVFLRELFSGERMWSMPCLPVPM